MRISEPQILDKILSLLDELKAVPKVQMEMFVEELTGASEAQVIYTIGKYGRQNTYVLTEYGLQKSRMDQLNRKTAMAMWAFMFLNKPVHEDFRLAKWPVSLLFRKKNDENLYRVTVCDNPAYDADLAALQAMQDDKRCTDVIVGEGFDVREINPKILPQSNFIYVRLDGNALTECPQSHITRVTLKEE